jgi:hypothetical protein
VVVAAGLTEIVAPVPAEVPPQLPEYQCQLAPVPNEPPDTLRSVLVPAQKLFALDVALAGSVDAVFTVTVTDAQAVVLQSPSALT